MSSLKDNLVTLRGTFAALRGPTSEPEPAPMTEPQIQPLSESPFAVHARRLIALAAELLPTISAQRLGPASPPVRYHLLTSQAAMLVLEARAGGSAEDRAQAAKAKAASDAVEAAWLAATAPAKPAPIAPPLPAPAVDRGLHTAGRPRVGSIVHRFDESVAVPSRACSPSVVMEIYPGAPNSTVSVSADGPYVRLQDLSGGRPVAARHISSPTFNASPGFRNPIVSWHRANECKR